ncbi:MAG: PP0621 family protein [Betaproteobacteria bacterium]
MGKAIFWIVIVFAVLLVLRLYNMGQQKKQARRDAAAPKPPETMVRCARCGVYLPRAEALLIGQTLRCRDKGCA